MAIEFDNTTLSLSLSLRNPSTRKLASDGQPMQFVELRLGISSQLVLRSSHQILQQTPSTLFAEALFPLPLRELQEPPFLSHFYVDRFLTSFNFSVALRDRIFQEIASFAIQLAAADLDLNFHIIVDVDSIQMLILEDSPPPPRRGASASAIERLKKEKFDGLIGPGAGGDYCSVCCDELHDGDNEVARIPCGHVYHKSCILTWLEISNSCPLCRRELEVEEEE